MFSLICLGVPLFLIKFLNTFITSQAPTTIFHTPPLKVEDLKIKLKWKSYSEGHFLAVHNS